MDFNETFFLVDVQSDSFRLGGQEELEYSKSPWHAENDSRALTILNLQFFQTER